MHHSGSGRLARPSPRGTFTSYSLPASWRSLLRVIRVIPPACPVHPKCGHSAKHSRFANFSKLGAAWRLRARISARPSRRRRAPALRACGLALLALCLERLSYFLGDGFDHGDALDGQRGSNPRLLTLISRERELGRAARPTARCSNLPRPPLAAMLVSWAPNPATVRRSAWRSSAR